MFSDVRNPRVKFLQQLCDQRNLIRDYLDSIRPVCFFPREMKGTKVPSASSKPQKLHVLYRTYIFPGAKKRVATARRVLFVYEDKKEIGGWSSRKL